MFLKTARNSKTGRTYLAIVHGYRDQNGVTRTKTIQSLGYLDVLEKEFDDPLTHFHAVAAAMEEARKNEENSTRALEIDLSQALDGEIYRKNFGFAPLSVMYHQLGLERFFHPVQVKRKLDYSLNSVVKLLVYDRILHPGSKKKAHENKDRYFERFDFSLEQTYRALTVIKTLKDSVCLHLHRRISDLYSRGSEIVYYDVTNYYFESEREDDFRCKGVCKEHRPNPIVQMGLLTDSAGIPITYDVFPGNTNDCTTLLPILSKVKKDYGMKRVVVVADRGLNTSNNIAYNIIKHDGYIFAGSILKSKASVKKWITDKSGYRKTAEGTYTKSRITERGLWIEGPSGKKAVTVEEKQVALWSRAYAKKARFERAKAAKKARALIKNPGSYTRATSRGATKYVKGIVFDKKTGEVMCGTHLTLDEDKMAAEAIYDGFYLISTSEMHMTDKEILTHYRGLSKIEESFKVTKSDMESRPVYVSTREHIEAHFLTCFIALTIIRLLERETGNKYSIAKMIESMNRACGSYLEQNLYLFDHCDDVLKHMGDRVGIDFTKKYRTLGEIKKVIGDTKK